MQGIISSRPRLLHIGIYVSACIATSAALLPTAPALAAEDTTSASSNDVRLVNKTTSKMDFEMSTKAKPDTWTAMSLKAGESKTYSDYNYIRITTRTNERVVVRTYDLSASPKRYCLTWNAKRKWWDVHRDQS
jgi:hypothetical protein